MLRAFIVSVLLLLPLFGVSAQADPGLYILNPGAYVRPGEAFQIHAELVNPIDSGIVIHAITGGGQTGGGGMPRRYPILTGTFPLHPGESLQFVIYEGQMPRGAQHGQSISLRNMSVKLDTGHFMSGQVYADFNTIRIASFDGGGDVSVFSDMDLVSSQAGVMMTDLRAEFSYPREVLAGESFAIEATVTNHYSEQVGVMTGVIFMQGGFREWQGEHARSYRFIECGEACHTSHETRLAPGESVSWQLGTLYYENDTLFNGELVLDGFMLSVVDHVGRHEIRELTTEPVIISVLRGGRNPAATAENSAAELQLRDLYEVGDQLLIFDPNTGYEWLKLSVGKDYSPAEMLEATRPNGAFSGFRLASSQEVESLYLNHMTASGVKLRDYSVYEMVSEALPLQQFVGLMGDIPTVNETLGFSAIVNDELPARHEPGAQYTVLTLSVSNRPAGQVTWISSNQGLRKIRREFGSPLKANTGYWLVR